jgi:hypothetical protein
MSNTRASNFISFCDAKITAYPFSMCQCVTIEVVMHVFGSKGSVLIMHVSFFGYILLTKSLSCTVADLTGMSYYFKVFKY